MAIGNEGVEIALSMEQNARTNLSISNEINFDGDGFGSCLNLCWSLGDGSISNTDEGGSSTEEQGGNFHDRLLEYIGER